jgi:hypothetical protein
MIESIAADKITSGKIYTNLVEILSESGNLDIADNTIQIKDDNKVTRVQIGKDANSDYNMYVWDKFGNLMFDAVGLTEKGINRPVIRNDMVKEDANISASKLDISSLFNAINNDGSHTLKSSKIYVDANKQTLDVAFKNMTTNVTNLQNTVTTQGTQLTAVQGAISSKVWQQDITTAVNGLQIGGRNLFQNTGYTRGNLYLGWYQSTTTAHKDEIVADNATLSGKARKITYVEAGSQGAYIDIPASLKSKKNLQKKVYTQSCLLKANKAISVTWGNSSPGFNKSTVNVSTEWQKFEIKTTVVVNYVFSKLTEFFVSNVTAGTELYIADYKFEEGEFATPWTPAPEDTDSSISAVDTKVTTISNQYTSLNQSLTSLTATVNSNTTKISEKADGSTVTALQANVTALTADLSGFKTTVSETYTSKTEFNNLQIGGRNLIRNSNFSDGLAGWVAKTGTLHIIEDTNFSHALSFNLTGAPYTIYAGVKNVWKKDQIYTVSFYAKCSSAGATIVASRSLIPTDSSEKLTLTTTWQKYIATFKSTDTVTGGSLSFQINNTKATYYIANIKLELGDKATDWTPAPEDIDEKFTEYSTTTQVNSAITQAANSVLTTVSSNYATKASLEVKIDKDKLISEINASADIITLKSNRFVLDSTNAKIAADGTVNFTGGTIAGWNISSAKLSGSAGSYGIAINKPVTSSTKVININHIDTTATATYVDDFNVTADGKLNAYNKVIIDGSGKDVGSYILMETWGNSGDKFQTKTTGLEYYTLDLTNRNYIKIQPEGIYFGNENESTHRGAVFLGSTNKIVSTFHQYQVQNENGVIKGWLSDKVFTMQDGWNNDAIYADWNGNFKCTGTKNRIVQTENFGTVAMNAFETAGAYFADVCSGKIASDGKCVVYLNRKFIETIDCDCEYQILITAVNKKSNLYVVKEREFFTVFGEPETYFDCMIIARQKGYVTTYADEEKNLNINREEVSVYDS